MYVHGIDYVPAAAKNLCKMGGRIYPNIDQKESQPEFLNF